jgi:choline dehydrogenase-like flavoprotein
MEAMLEAVKKGRKLMLTPPLSDLRHEWVPEADGCEAWDDEQLRTYIRQFAETTWHYSCTARMGREGDPAAAVDPRLRVQGVRGLRVADASVWPCVTSGNTNVPADTARLEPEPLSSPFAPLLRLKIAISHAPAAGDDDGGQGR